MSQLFTNNAATTLAVALTAGGLSATVATGAGALFPTPTNGDYAKVTLTQAGNAETTWEIARLTARSGDVLTLVRGQEGTAAAAWAIGAKLELRATAGYLAAAPAAKGAGDDAAFIENDGYITKNYTLGQAGLTACTVTIAAPGVVSQVNNYIGGEAIFFNTTGALPTGLSTNTTYYVSATGLTTASFQVSATRGGASITTTGTQSGVHTSGKAKSAVMMGPLVVATGAIVIVPTGQRLIVL